MMAVTGDSKDRGRSSMVSVRLGADEEEAVRKMAAEKGASVSQFIRDAVLDRCRLGASSLDIQALPVSASVSASGLVLEARDGQLFPKTVGNGPYVSVG
jgi:hypothetical protein